MKKDLHVFIHTQYHAFFKNLYRLIYFFPYFFSVKTLIATFFFPWKLIVTKKEIRGFSLSEWANRLLMNIISSGIGAIMRFSMLSFFTLFEGVYILLLPFLVILYSIFVLPILVGIYLTQPTPEELRAQRKRQFVDNHSLTPASHDAVEVWFEALESQKKPDLFSIPPLARDWAYGYTPLLDAYVTDLTSPSYQSITRHMVGRTKEILHIKELLTKSQEANVILVGEEGVGKHTVVDALARMIYEGSSGPALAYKRVLKLNMEKLLTTTTDVKQRETFMENLFAEAVEAKSIVLVIENFDRYVSSGEGRIDLTIPIEKYAKQSTIQFMGITNPFMYQQYVARNDKIQRLFSPVQVPEISKEEALQTILFGIPTFEQKYHLVIPYETAETVVVKSEFYITSIPFPEKALELMDEACAHTTSQQSTSPHLIRITPSDIDATLTTKTHMPTTLTDEMRQKLLTLKQTIGQHILFQDDALAQLAAALRRSFVVLGKRKKPLASFLFLGPTGVGKTETAKTLARIFFGNESYLIRFDMSLYQSRNDIKTLFGSIETGTPGLLVQAVRQQPYAVLLLDELEKAHPDLLNIFLTIIDEGYFTDGFGRRVDCKNLIVIATSNAGSDYIYKEQQILNRLDQIAIGGSNGGGPTNPRQNLIDYLIQNHLFSPEFLNRFDGVVQYQPLRNETVLALARHMTTEVCRTIYDLYKIHIAISDETLQEIITQGFNPAFGARNLHHVLSQKIEDKVALLILAKKVSAEQTVTI